MNTRLTSLVLGIFLAATAYGQGYKIEGEITGLEDGTMVKLSNYDLRLVMDSCTVKNGRFQFNGQVEVPHKAILRVYEPGNPRVIGYNSFYLDNAAYKVDAQDVESFKNEYLTTSRGANLHYNKLMKMTEDVRQRQTEMRDAPKYNRELGQSLYVELVNLEKHYLKENTNSFPALDLLIRYARSLDYQERFPNRKIQLQLDSLKYYYNRLDRNLKKTMKAEALYTSIYGNKVTGEGQPYMELELTMTLDKKPFKLTDVQTEYILLDFTGVHCGWCKKFNARILPEYHRIRDKIEIVSFYTDTNIEWVREDIRKNEIPWVVVSDFKGDYSPNKRRYQIHGIPDFFLLDQDRNIIRHQVGYNEDFIWYLIAIGTGKGG